MVGHSSGEIAAAHACGALSVSAAITIAYYRGYVNKEQALDGAMASIGLGRKEILPFCKDGVVIACENSPSNTTISGDRKTLEEVINTIQKNHPEVFLRKLRVKEAYHSSKEQL